MPEIKLTDDNFKAEVLNHQGLVLVDFWATWCPPCKLMLPIIDELAEELKGQPIKIGKINVDENPQISQQFNIMSIPALVFFKDGREVARSIGAQSKEGLKTKINELLSS